MVLNGHLWTVGPRLAAALRPPPAPPSRGWETLLDDPRVGRVRLTGRLTEPAGAERLVLLVHGLGGSAESPYMRHAAHVAASLGLAALRLNLRGADRLGEDFYHAGLTVDLDAACASPDLARYASLLVLGASLGGHLALWWVLGQAPPRVERVAALCTPLDLALSQRSIDRPERWLYRRYVLRSISEIYAEVAARRPVPTPVERVRRVRTIREWDDLTVAPRFGFADAADYYARVSVAPRLGELAVPALLVLAEGDPMVPAETVRPALAPPPPRLTVRWAATGGHVGFPRQADLGLSVLRGVVPPVVGWLAGI